MTFYNKYIKYKKKYLDIKNRQQGGFYFQEPPDFTTKYQSTGFNFPHGLIGQMKNDNELWEHFISEDYLVPAYIEHVGGNAINFKNVKEILSKSDEFKTLAIAFMRLKLFSEFINILIDDLEVLQSKTTANVPGVESAYISASEAEAQTFVLQLKTPARVAKVEAARTKIKDIPIINLLYASEETLHIVQIMIIYAIRDIVKNGKIGDWINNQDTFIKKLAPIRNIKCNACSMPIPKIMYMASISDILANVLEDIKKIQNSDTIINWN